MFNVICFVIIAVCVVTAATICIACIWKGLDYDTAWKAFTTLCVIATATVALSVANYYTGVVK